MCDFERGTPERCRAREWQMMRGEAVWPEFHCDGGGFRYVYCHLHATVVAKRLISNGDDCWTMNGVPPAEFLQRFPLPPDKVVPLKMES